MPRMLLRAALALAAGLSIPAPAQGAAPAVSYRTFSYVCDAGQRLRVTYLRYGPQTTFAVVSWKGAQYGLAPALSASGARYAALGGPAGARSGLEWWEHGGGGTLSAFVDGRADRTRPLATGCRTGR